MDKNIISVEQLGIMATNVAKSGLFPDINTREKAFTLMMLCQAEGIHPMQALKKYNIIQGRPAMKADAMLAEFNRLGGLVTWLQYTEKVVEAEFKHPNGSKLKIIWTWDMASKITQYSSFKKRAVALTEKDNWKNYSRQMLKARVISEGLRAIMPEVCMGVYTPEEVQDFGDIPEKPKNGLTKPQIKKPEAIEEAKPEPNVLPAGVKSDPAKPLVVEPEVVKEETGLKTKPDAKKALSTNQRFLNARKVLGNENYYFILSKFNVKSATEFKDKGEAMEALTALEANIALEDFCKEDEKPEVI